MSAGGERIVSVDYVKAISIFLVLLSHTAIPVGLSVWISEFHVPLFFFASGFLFSFSRNPRTMTFAKKRARQLLVPFVWLDIVSYVFWLLAGRNYGADAGLSLSWYRPLVCSLSGDTDGMVHNLSLWFFPSLFLTGCCCHVVMKWLSDYGGRTGRSGLPYSVSIGLPAAFLIVGWAVYELMGNIRLFIGQSLVMSAFYVSGHVFRCFSEGHSFVSKPRLVFFGMAALLLTLCGTSLNDKVTVYNNYYGTYPLFVVFALSGISLMVVAGVVMSRVFGENRVVRLISDNTLLICGLHLMFFSIIKGVLFFLFGITTDIFSDAIVPNLLLSLAAIAFCLPVAVGIRRCLPWLIGVKR